MNVDSFNAQLFLQFVKSRPTLTHREAVGSPQPGNSFSERGIKTTSLCVCVCRHFICESHFLVTLTCLTTVVSVMDAFVLDKKCGVFADC